MDKMKFSQLYTNALLNNAIVGTNLSNLPKDSSYLLPKHTWVNFSDVVVFGYLTPTELNVSQGRASKRREERFSCPMHTGSNWEQGWDCGCLSQDYFYFLFNTECPKYLA